MSLDYVDLYLIHHPGLAKPDLKTSWEQMEKLQKAGKAKSIGVSNYGITHLQTLLKTAKVKPAVNQIEFHPECLDTQLPIHEFGNEHGIVTEAYSLLNKLNRLASKFYIAYSTSSKKTRLEGYIKAGDIQLSSSDIHLIDTAGLKARRLRRISSSAKCVLVGLVTVGAVLKLGRVFGMF